MSFVFLPLTFFDSFEIVIDRFFIISFLFGVILFFSFFDNCEYTPFIEGYIFVLLTVYSSILIIKLQKEILFFIVNNLLSWLFDVLRNIGKLIKNAWLLNFVHRNKLNNSK
ncbi:hypothetical protein N9591_00190 [Flavobacteriaceae bacterium]|nr:hypothetical protein [Flavobacteriaceae bacterium]